MSEDRSDERLPQATDILIDDESSEAEEVLDEMEPERQSAASDDDEGEDLFGDDMMDDYRRDRNDAEDRYDPTMLDDTEQVEMTGEERRRAEEAMSRNREPTEGADENRRRVDQYYGGIRRLLQEDDPTDQREDARIRRRRARRRQIGESKKKNAPSPEDAKAAVDELPYYDSKVNFSEDIEVCLEIIFSNFIWNFSDEIQDTTEIEFETVGLYVEKLVDIIRDDRNSLYIAWKHIQSELPKVHEWFAFKPLRVFRVMDKVVNGIVLFLYGDLYKSRHIKVRLSNFADYSQPMTTLTCQTLNSLIAVEGVVVKRSNVLPKVRELYLECVNSMAGARCGQITGPIETTLDVSSILKEPRVCGECQRPGPFFLSKESTVYQTVQYITIQEMPSAVANRRAPVQKDVMVDGDLVDKVRPGDDVLLLAYHGTKKDSRMNLRLGFPIMGTILIANNIVRRSDIKMSELKPEEVVQFYKLAKQPQVREKILNSIAPSIWGHRHAKMGLAMSMFGGVRQEVPGREKHSVRGDINVLLVGDPGMAKSQLLKYVHKVVEKSVATTGKGASAAGLTASMKKDPLSGEYTLEGGALVLADTGICLIDEFDKMSELDRVSIHEAMEAQTISISKAGIVTTLKARCAVIAAANPIFGRYDPSLTFSENVTLGDTILSRFDVVAVMKDNPNPVHDLHMAEYILKMHTESHPDVLHDKRLGMADDAGEQDMGEAGDASDFIEGDAIIPHAFLAKYVMYARKNIHPKITENEQSKIAEFYAQVRQAAVRSGGLPLTVRHLESILRMATANAKMRLSNSVSRQDIDFAISTMLESFIQSQKSFVAQNLSKKFGRYRALANNPYSMIEDKLSELLANRGQELLQNVIFNSRSGRRDRLQDTDMSFLLGGSVIVDELMTLVRTYHDIQPQLVENYIISPGFKKKFRLGTNQCGERCIYAGSQRDDLNIDYVGSQTVEA